MKFAKRKSSTPLFLKSFLNGKRIPPFISEALRRYAPITIINMPKSLIKLGISFKVIAAIMVVKTGLKEEIGEIREIADIEIANIDEIPAIVSIMLSARVKSQNCEVTLGMPPVRSTIMKAKGRLNILFKNNTRSG